MNASAARIVTAIEHATRHMMTKNGTFEAPPLDPKKPWGPHCSAMFRETMRQLQGGGRRVPSAYTDENANANTLGQRIRQNKSDWAEVSFDEIQQRANNGELIIGSYINAHGEGHLGFVYPTDIQRSDAFVRDGNIHGKIRATSTYGAVGVHLAFPVTMTKWFRYRH